MSSPFVSRSRIRASEMPLGYVCAGCSTVHGGAHVCKQPLMHTGYGGLVGVRTRRQVAETNEADAHRWFGHAVAGRY